MQFLAPLGFLSLLAVLLPVAIHLLSRKPGTIIKVGSLQFLTSSPSARFKSLQLSEPFLLFLRITLLVLLALLLSQPVWLAKISASSSSPRGRVLVAPELLHEPKLGRIRPLLDSLAAAGHELHRLSAGFPALSFSDAITSLHAGQSHWSLLREWEKAQPSFASIQVLTTDRILAYRGERPALQHRLIWKVFPVAQSQQFVQSEKKHPGGFIRLQPAPDSVRAAIVYKVTSMAEARYLQSALRVAAEEIPLRLRLQLVSWENGELPWDNFDLLFWLVEDSLPASAQRQMELGLTVITTAGSQDEERCESWIVMPQAGAHPAPRLWRRSPAANRGAPIWTDGSGMPLLEAERLGRGWQYRFASRFDAAWNELVMHTAFPEWLLALLLRDDILGRREPVQWDQRRISAAQSLPQEGENSNAADTRFATQSLHFPLWLLAVIIFGIERWMSDRKST